MTNRQYTAGDIQVLEGLDAVRMRPGMYIGTTGVKGLHHILWEIVDNAVDEAANGFADRLSIVLNTDNSATVSDNGRGIPVDIHPQLKISGVEVVYTQLHAGGKFNNENYSYSGGLHGVGASVTNALSKWLNVEVFRNGKKYVQSFHSFYDEKSGKVKSGVPVKPLEETERGENEPEHGTRVTFLPDKEVFGNGAFNFDTINKRVKELAFLNKGIEFSITDLRTEGEDGEPLSAVYRYEGGLADFVRYLNENKAVLHSPICYSASNDVMIMEFAIQQTTGYSENIFSYVNNIPTPEGGTHETGFKAAMTKVFNDYAREKKFLKEKDDNLIGEDYREGMTAVLSIKMKNVQFEGQTKTKLGNVEAKTACDALTQQGLTEFLSSHPDTAEVIIRKAVSAAKVREAARKAKEIARTKNTIQNANLVGKLSSCTSRDYTSNELFIVEGDSAGGSAKQARSRKFQAILPLRGKPLNCYGLTKKVVYENEEFNLLQAALNIEEDMDNLRYNKVVIATDADVDGMHIRLLMMTFFLQFFPEVIRQGHLFVLQTPLFRVRNKKETLYCYSEEERLKAVARCGANAEITRFKGLGEISPDEFKEFIGENMRLDKVRITKDDPIHDLLEFYMGKNTYERQGFIIDNLRIEEDIVEQDLAIS